MALLRGAELIPKSWKFEYKISDAVRPLWRDDLRGPDVVFAQEKAWVRPTHNVAKQLAEFTAEEKERLETMGRFDRAREEKRILHNREAQKEGWCQVGLINVENGYTTTCGQCGREFGIGHRSGGNYIGIDWKRARKQCQSLGNGV